MVLDIISVEVHNATQRCHCAVPLPCAAPKSHPCHTVVKHSGLNPPCQCYLRRYLSPFHLRDPAAVLVMDPL